jgi:hypothetical protein
MPDFSGVCRQKAKAFFFEKKNQKLVLIQCRDVGVPVARSKRSFLLLFFKKEGLA